MKESVGFCDFCDRFRSMNREDSFSYQGKKSLFEYLEEYEESCGIEIELDVIALCCEYTEDSIDSILENYGLDSVDELRDHTTVIKVDDETIIIQDY